MLITRKRGWELPERFATPEAVFMNRRAFMGGAASAIALAASDNALADDGSAETDPSATLYPAPINPKFKDAGRPITAEEYNVTFNNFYEFGSSKRIASHAAKLPIRPWEIAFDG